MFSKRNTKVKYNLYYVYIVNDLYFEMCQKINFYKPNTILRLIDITLKHFNRNSSSELSKYLCFCFE